MTFGLIIVIFSPAQQSPAQAILIPLINSCWLLFFAMKPADSEPERHTDLCRNLAMVTPSGMMVDNP
jgi:hypothetical protein